MLRLIPRKQPGISVSAILEGLENDGFTVTRRTVERDLNELALVFQLSSTENERPQRWFWAGNASFDIPGVSLTEAISLGLLRQVISALMPKYFTASLEDRFALADQKLSDSSAHRYAKWTELIAYTPPGLPFIPPAIDPTALESIHTALLEKRQLTFIYRSPYQEKKKTYTVNPLGIHLHGQRPYFLASVSDHPTVFQFAIQRMGKTEILEQPSIPLPGFSLADHLAEGGSQSCAEKTITLRATLNDHLASLLEETPLSTDQKITRKPDKITLTATLQQSWQLDFWLLSQGPAITVQKPISVRKYLIARLNQTLINYTEE